jgi:hypothetical protein
MAQQKVMTYTCDTCGHDEHFPIKRKDSKPRLPKGWVHVMACTAHNPQLLDRLLCPEHADYLIHLSQQLRWEDRLEKEVL